MTDAYFHMRRTFEKIRLLCSERTLQAQRRATDVPATRQTPTIKRPALGNARSAVPRLHAGWRGAQGGGVGGKKLQQCVILKKILRMGPDSLQSVDTHACGILTAHTCCYPPATQHTETPTHDSQTTLQDGGEPAPTAGSPEHDRPSCSPGSDGASFAT